MIFNYTGNAHMRQQWPLHGDNAYRRRFQAAANSLAAWKWVVDISAFQNSLECIYTRDARIIHSRLCWNQLISWSKQLLACWTNSTFRVLSCSPQAVWTLSVARTLSSQTFCASEDRTIILILCSRSTKPVDLSTDRIAVFRKIFGWGRIIRPNPRNWAYFPQVLEAKVASMPKFWPRPRPQPQRFGLGLRPERASASKLWPRSQTFDLGLASMSLSYRSWNAS